MMEGLIDLGKLKTGAKTGVMASLIYALLETAVVLVLFYSFKSSTLNSIDLNELPYVAVGLVLVTVSFGVAAGLVRGLDR